MTRKFSIVCLALLAGLSACSNMPTPAMSFNPYQAMNPNWHPSPALNSNPVQKGDRRLDGNSNNMWGMMGNPFGFNNNLFRETKPIDDKDDDNNNKNDQNDNNSNNMGAFAGAAMPMAAMMAGPMMAGSMMAMHNPIVNPFHPAHYVAATLHNPNSLTRFDDGDENFANSLSRSAFPELRVRHQCESIQRQALQVANNLIKRQNKVMFKEIMNYLLKSKFLIGLTEIKLSKVLKQKFLGVIKKFTDLTEDNVRLIHSADDELLDDEVGMGDDDSTDNDDFLFDEKKPVKEKAEPAPVPTPQEDGEDKQDEKKEDKAWWDFFRGRKIRKNK
jgi:hypothetical protein